MVGSIRLILQKDTYNLIGAWVHVIGVAALQPWKSQLECSKNFALSLSKSVI